MNETLERRITILEQRLDILVGEQQTLTQRLNLLESRVHVEPHTGTAATVKEPPPAGSVQPRDDRFGKGGPEEGLEWTGSASGRKGP